MVLPRVVLVSGASNGIGYETVKALLLSRKSYHVLLGSRSVEKGTQALTSVKQECPDTTNTVELLPLELTSDQSIERAFESVSSKHDRLDVLINNAGATFDIEYLRGTVSLRECFNKAYDVNVVGTNILTHMFMPLLLKSDDPRLIFVAGLSHITQAAEKYFPTPDRPAGWPKPPLDFETIGYRCSKVALNMLMLDWNHKLKADGVKVWGVGPGFLATGLGNIVDKAKHMGAGHPSIGGEWLVRVVEGERDGDTGKIVVRNGFMPW